MQQYVFLVAGWAVYFALHSALASERVKKIFPQKIYRLVYVLIAAAGLLALLFYNDSIQAVNFFKSQGPVRYASLLVTTLGVMIIHSSFRHYSIRGFLGFGEERQELKTDGILLYIRHPIYAGTILVVTGFFLYIPNLPTLISCLCTFIYLPIGIYLEEKKLLARFGDRYSEYRKKVPALFPRIP